MKFKLAAKIFVGGLIREGIDLESAKESLRVGLASQITSNYPGAEATHLKILIEEEK